MEHFCEVVPVYMRPQSMVNEQACFGVIVRCPSANFYGYRLAEGDEAAIARIVSFFPRCGRAGLERATNWAKQDIEYTFDLERNKCVVGTDPVFRGAAAGDYRIGASSPCAYAGRYNSWMDGASDFFGNPRTTPGKKVSIGYCQAPNRGLMLLVR